MKKLIVLATLIAVAGSVQANTIGWGAFADGDFANAANWFDGGPGSGPAGTDDLYVDTDYNPFGAPITTSVVPKLSSLSDNAFLLIVSPFYDASVTITTGGDLQVSAISRLGHGALMNGSTGTLNMDGGNMYSQVFEVGYNGNDGTNTLNAGNGVVNMSGDAVVQTGDLRFGQEMAGYGFDAAANATGQINMTGDAMIIVNGDQTAQSWVGNGYIAATGAGESISVFYNGAETEYTVIPEPATLGLVGILGGAMLWIRKRSKR